jgi:hypothetical protein
LKVGFTALHIAPHQRGGNRDCMARSLRIASAALNNIGAHAGLPALIRRDELWRTISC